MNVTLGSLVHEGYLYFLPFHDTKSMLSDSYAGAALRNGREILFQVSLTVSIIIKICSTPHCNLFNCKDGRMVYLHNAIIDLSFVKRMV